MPLLPRTKTDTYPFISPSANLAGSARGKTILITGASRGIGRGIAIAFAVAGAGSVILTARRREPLEEAKTAILQAIPTCKVVLIPTDVTDETSVAELFGSLPYVPDVLINNAGSFSCAAPITDSNPSAWWNDFEVSVKGTYLCTRAYLRSLDGRPGTILNVSSLASVMLNQDQSSYGITKTAVNRFTTFVHAEHASQGVRCIAFHPGGIVDTDLGQAAPDWLKARLTDKLALATDTALYLSTERAAFLSGRFVLSNWNMERLEALKDEVLCDNLLTTGVKTQGEMLESTPIEIE